MSDNIQPFRIQIPQPDVDYLHHRLATARWPGELPGTGWTRGIPADYLKELAEYWHQHYDWRAAETNLNAYPQFTTGIDGQIIHFLHVTSNKPDAKPPLITHGFPSSVAEFGHLIEPLVNPPPARPSTSSRRPCPATRSPPRSAPPAGPWAAPHVPGPS